jgi:bifunctional non-homologous end joining protein LigD
MPKSLFEPCIPTRAAKVPSHPDWIHEVKHDGFRLIVSRDGSRVRLYSRNGADFTKRYPLIVQTALRIRTQQFVLDGEAVLLGVDGVSDFDGLMSRQFDNEVMLYAFDALAIDGEDLRNLPLHFRKNNLARLLARRADAIHLAPFEQGEIGPDIYRQACLMGLEGLVSKRKDSRYRAGRSADWIKVKNPASPAMKRAKDAFG